MERLLTKILRRGEAPPPERNYSVGHSAFMVLPTPEGIEHLMPEVKKVWTRRGYGFWPNGLRIPTEEKEVLKSMIQTELIRIDRPYFENLEPESKFRKAFSLINIQIADNLQSRRIILKHRVSSGASEDTGNTLLLIEGLLSSFARAVVAASLREITPEQEGQDVKELFEFIVNTHTERLAVLNRNLPHQSAIIIGKLPNSPRK